MDMVDDAIIIIKKKSYTPNGYTVPTEFCDCFVPDDIYILPRTYKTAFKLKTPSEIKIHKTHVPLYQPLIPLFIIL